MRYAASTCSGPGLPQRPEKSCAKRSSCCGGRVDRRRADMYEHIWQAAGRHIQPARMQAEIEEYFTYSRLSSYDAINALSRVISGNMEAAGLSDVRLIQFPADGRTFYGGWCMPRAYDTRSARLEDLSDGGA